MGSGQVSEVARIGRAYTVERTALPHALAVPKHVLTAFSLVALCQRSPSCSTAQAGETFLVIRRIACPAIQLQPTMRRIRCVSPPGPFSAVATPVRTKKTATRRPVATEYQAQPRAAGSTTSRRASTKQAADSEMKANTLMRLWLVP